MWPEFIPDLHPRVNTWAKVYGEGKKKFENKHTYFFIMEIKTVIQKACY